MGYLLYSFVLHWATLGLHLCVFQGNLVLGLQSQSPLHVLSYPWATLVCGPRYKILVFKRLTLSYGLPIAFSCFALGYYWATFMCSPKVAQIQHVVDRYLVKQDKNV